MLFWVLFFCFLFRYSIICVLSNFTIYVYYYHWSCFLPRDDNDVYSLEIEIDKYYWSKWIQRGSPLCTSDNIRTRCSMLVPLICNSLQDGPTHHLIQLTCTWSKMVPISSNHAWSGMDHGYTTIICRSLSDTDCMVMDLWSIGYVYILCY